MNYRFNIGEEVKVRGSKDIAEIFIRRFRVFPFFNDLTLLPGKYYDVVFKNLYKPGEPKIQVNRLKFEFRENYLEKISQ